MTDSAVVEGHVKLRDGKKVPRSRRPFGTGGPDRRPPRPAGGGASPLSPPPALPNPVLFASRCSGRVGGWCCASPPRWQVRAGRRRGGPGVPLPSLPPPPADGWGGLVWGLRGSPRALSAAGDHRGPPLLLFFLFLGDTHTRTNYGLSWQPARRPEIARRVPK